MQHADEDGADHRAGDAADAAEQAGAADHHGGDDGELIADAGHRFRRIEPGREHEAGKAGEEADDHIDQHQNALDRQPGQPRRLEIAADRIDVAAEARVASARCGRAAAKARNMMTGAGTGADAALAPPDDRPRRSR